MPSRPTAMNTEVGGYMAMMLDPTFEPKVKYPIYRSAANLSCGKKERTTPSYTISIIRMESKVNMLTSSYDIAAKPMEVPITIFIRACVLSLSSL